MYHPIYKGLKDIFIQIHFISGLIHYLNTETKIGSKFIQNTTSVDVDILVTGYLLIRILMV